MKQISTPNRRQFCLSLLSLTAIAGCGTSGRPVARRSAPQSGSTNVALLLPLSGARAGLGQQMAKAVWLVEDLSGAPRRSLVLDAGETPDSAASAAVRAVNEGADVIVGPLFRDQTPATVQAAADIPVITLSNDDALASQGAWVFGVTPEQSVDAVLRYAGESGARRITMLSRGDDLGRKASEALARGTNSARTQLLPPVSGNVDPADMAQALRQAGGGELPDIIYVPSSNPKALSQAVAAVKSGVTTIGSLQWSGLPSDDFTRLDKACFTGPDPDRFNRLSAAYRSQLEEELGVIAALAVDAVAMAQTTGGGRTLARRQPLEGLLGTARFERDRTCKRDLAVLRIDGGDVLRVA